MNLVFAALTVGGLAILLAIYIVWRILREDVEDSGLVGVADYIRDGTNAFIKRMYKTIAVFYCITSYSHRFV